MIRGPAGAAALANLTEQVQEQNAKAKEAQECSAHDFHVLAEPRAEASPHPQPNKDSPLVTTPMMTLGYQILTCNTPKLSPIARRLCSWPRPAAQE